MRSVRLRITGRVQGVGYRAWMMRQASALGLRGWVRNRADGSVECLAEGPRPRLEDLVGELRRGPRSADVGEVRVDWQAARGDLPAEFHVTA